jgi:hypothetical protein
VSPPNSQLIDFRGGNFTNAPRTENAPYTRWVPPFFRPVVQTFAWLPLDRVHDKSFAALDIAIEAALQFDVVEIDSGRRSGRPASRRHQLFE